MPIESISTATKPLMPVAWQDFLAALLAGDRAQCTTLTQQALAAGVDISDLYQHLFEPALYQVGELWATHRLSVAAEHRASSIIENLLNQIYPQVISPRRVSRSIVVGTVEGELHQIGPRMVCDLFEMQGWDTFFPGAGLQISEMLCLLRERKPDVVGLSLSLGFHIHVLQDMLAILRAEFPDLPILVGGQGLRWIGTPQIAMPKVRHVADLNQLRQVIAALK